MQIEVYPTYSSTTERMFQNHTAIVVDLLRATTSIIYAVFNGAEKVIPVAEIEDAIAVSKTLDQKKLVLAGERNGLPIPSFNLGNSPDEFSREAVMGKTVVITTTNGTSAIHRARAANPILIGALANRSAVAKKAIETGNDIIVLCSGTKGQFTNDDICAAGGIIDALLEYSSAAPEMNDLAYTSHFIYSNWKTGHYNISNTRHYKKLLSLGLEQDIKTCFQADVTDVVPIFENGLILGNPC